MMKIAHIRKPGQNKPLMFHPGCWAVMIVGIGVLGLSGWALSSRSLVTIIPDSVTIAPISALLFILLGISLYLAEYGVHDLRFMIVQDVLLIPPALIGIMVFLMSFFGKSSIIHWYIHSPDQIYLIAPESSMSPVSALLFLLSALGLYINRYQFRYAPVLAIILSSSGAFLIIGYLLGNPFIYGMNIKPTSFLSALGFLFCGIGQWMCIHHGE